MKVSYVILLFVSLLFFASCGITKEDLGFKQKGPDESLVKKNVPLVLPPEYNVRPK